MTKRTWNTAEAIALARVAEGVAPLFGAHVALTGGTLYGEGERKDVDLLFYRIRQTPEIDVKGLFEALAERGLIQLSGFGWVHKASWFGKPVDVFFPEFPAGEYNAAQEGGAK